MLLKSTPLQIEIRAIALLYITNNPGCGLHDIFPEVEKTIQCEIRQLKTALNYLKDKLEVNCNLKKYYNAHDFEDNENDVSQRTIAVDKAKPLKISTLPPCPLSPFDWMMFSLNGSLPVEKIRF